MVLGLMAVVRSLAPKVLYLQLTLENFTDYAASKGGLNSMMMNLSSHLAELNITVNSVSPAMVGSTGMIPDEDSVPGLVETIPLGRLCKPSEVANVVSMFACTGFVTGQSLVVAGGLKHL
jgi:3-oxoacyl-[acyl-carrier protein] reductase